LNGTHLLLVSAVDVSLLGENIISKENTKAVLDASKDVVVEANAEKTMCIVMSHHLSTGQNNYIMVANKSVENVAEFKY
jgi:hypothetical protein